MALTKAKRQPSTTRQLTIETRNLFKGMVKEAEERGYARGLKAALSIVRPNRRKQS